MQEPARPRNLAEATEAIRDLTVATRAVDRRLRRRTQLFTAVVVLFLVAVTSRTEVQQRQITRNQRLIVRTQHDQCVLRNEGTARQNTLIDSAIAAEKRRPKPDMRRIRDLEDFKGATPPCGPEP